MKGIIIASIVFSVAFMSDGLFAQSVPVGQVSHQIANQPSRETSQNRSSAFKNNFDAELFKSEDVTSNQADAVLNAIPLGADLPAAINSAKHAAMTNPAAMQAIKAAQAQTAAAQNLTTVGHCTIDNTNNTYSFTPLFPLKGCDAAAVQNFFNVKGPNTLVQGVQYLYNAKQSTNQINSDFYTATFPLGFQAVLSGTATAGSAQPAGTSTTTSTSQTDSASTAVSKLEQGGDFNVRFPIPLYFNSAKALIYTFSSPSIGFNVSGLSGQNTITQSTEYNVNVPLEFYAQTTSIETISSGGPAAMLYLDIKPSMELVSSAFAKDIGLTSNRYFFLGQVSAGIEFSQSVRVSLQYFIGPKQVYQMASASSPNPTTVTSSLSGLHLVVSFSPQSQSK